MSWFIFSEVMFFGAFFSALWWARVHSVPTLAGPENALLWPDFQSSLAQLLRRVPQHRPQASLSPFKP
jgi:heme/copper-type cytochrome/quinol oxidase subunit 3